MNWQPIETAPQVKGNYFWCLIAWGPEDGQSIGMGMRHEGRWFCAGCFHQINAGRKYVWREIEVSPTHWMPTPAPPEVQS